MIEFSYLASWGSSLRESNCSNPLISLALSNRTSFAIGLPRRSLFVDRNFSGIV